MRTTLEIRDDVLEKMKAYAAARSISNGSAATKLIERGLTAEVPTFDQRIRSLAGTGNL